MGEPKTADDLAMDAAKFVDEGAKPEPTPAPQTEPEKAPIVEAELSEDDLDPDKIEAGMTAKTLSLDQAGLLKRFKKVHANAKELKAWRAEREPKMTGYEKQAQAVDRMLAGLSKLRSKDAPEKQSFLEDLIETLMDEKGTPNWASAKESIEKIMASGQLETNGAKPSTGEAPELAEMRRKVESLEADRNNDKLERAQADLNQKVARAYVEIPKELGKIEEFKGLPWKDADWKKEFEELLDDAVLGWSNRNQDKVNKGELPPFMDLAKKAAKPYLRGGSDILKRQVEGGKGQKLGRSDGPSGQQPRQLPKAGDRDSEEAYLQDLANSLTD